MQDIEPFYGWEHLYDSAQDQLSPFYGETYDTTRYSSAIYGYYIHPLWDYIGTETLYLKILFTDYDRGFSIIELFGEWNDTLHNDVMFLKRNIIDHLTQQGITKFVLIGENVFNFHGSDDCYYEEWYEEVEEGWIVATGFQDHVLKEWKRYNVDAYIHFGGKLEVEDWRTLHPRVWVEILEIELGKRLS